MRAPVWGCSPRMGCCWRPWEVKVRVWCYKSTSMTMKCLHGVPLAPTWRKNGSLVLRERHCDNTVPKRAASDAYRA